MTPREKAEEFFERVRMAYGDKPVRDVIDAVLDDREFQAFSADEKAVFALLLVGRINFGHGKRA